MKKLILSAIIFVTAFTATADQTNAAFPMPNRFEGIRLGMSMDELVKACTNIMSIWHDKAGGGIDLTRTNETLYELYRGNDPVWGELGPTNDPVCMAGGIFDFQEGKLKRLAFTWFGERTNILKYRAIFLTSCVQLWGGDFQKRAMLKKQGSVYPALVWIKNNHTLVFILEADEGSIGNHVGFGFHMLHNDDRILDLKDESLVRDRFKQLVEDGVIPKS
jgi:hypothetical protein